MPDSRKWPNVVFVDQNTIATDQPTKSLANSIGNASYDVAWGLQEIKKGLALLHKGQLLISSVYGTGTTRKEIINDFVYLAQRVQEIGVHAIELNCSCPNVSGLYYQDIPFMHDLVSAVARAITIPIIIKVGIADSHAQLTQLLVTIAHAGARGVSGINTIRTKIVDKSGKPFFGEGRMYAGLSGDAIGDRALAWVRNAAMINEKNKLGLTILGGGGIVAAEQFDLILDAGAHIGMTATGAILDPYIAMNYHRNRYGKRNLNSLAGSEHVI